MKHILKFTVFTAIFIAASSSFVYAQENVLTNKKGTPILPTAGTWAIGVDASPFLNYFGRLFSDQGATAPTFNGTTFFGKYFVQDNRALRFGAFVNMWSYTFFSSDNKIGSPREFVENTHKRSVREVRLFFGTERRLGTNRLQGFYGLEGSLGFGTAQTKETITWANPLGSDNTNSGWWRTLAFKPGIPVRIGTNVFAGVEYFIVPGISLGGRVGYGVNLKITGQPVREEERWAWGEVQRRTTKVGDGNDFNFNNFGGGIALTFHLNR